MSAAGGAIKAQPWNDPHAKPYVQVEHITKSFGDFKAVDDVSLKIYKGEIFCLLGASGCGKTTLLRMLGGFETPTSGKILIDGEDMTGVPPYERPVNMMFQSYALFPHMTVEQNVAFGLKQDRGPHHCLGRRTDAVTHVNGAAQFLGADAHILWFIFDELAFEHVDGAHEVGHEFGAGELVNLCRRAGLHDLALIHDTDAAGERHNLFLIVGDNHAGHPQFILDPDKFELGMLALGRSELPHAQVVLLVAG